MASPTLSQDIARAFELLAELTRAIDSVPDGVGNNDDVDIDQVEALLKLKRAVLSVHSESANWKETQEANSAYRASLAKRLKPELQVRLLLDGLDASRWCDATKSELLRILDEPDVNPRDVAAAWEMLRDGKLDPVAASACKALATHALVSAPRSRRSTNNDDDYDDETPRNPKVSAAESFLVLLAFEKADTDLDEAVVALRISQECDARLCYQPSTRPIRLEGELLSGIRGLSRNLSPAIRHRREIGIVFNNRTSDFFRYLPELQVDKYCLGSEYGSALSIELPHLVYALVERVEIDITSSSCARLRYVSPGSEVLLAAFNKNEIQPCTNTRSKMTTLVGVVKTPADSTTVCTHVTVGVDAPFVLRAVRVYGRALVW